MEIEIAKALTQGLIEGYAGKGIVSNIARGVFAGKCSHVEGPSGEVYHDEWFAGIHLGGGQELVRVGEQIFTRLYGGGTPSPEILAELGNYDRWGGSLFKAKDY